MSVRDPLDALEEALGYRFRDRSFLERALTHSSLAAEKGAAGIDNERLEFLGDSVLNFLVSEALFHRWPTLDEGILSKARSHLVAEPSFAAAARSLGVGAAVGLGAGEARSGGHARDSLLADAFEAVVAAVLLDGGIDAARALAGRVLAPAIDTLDPAALADRDPKTALQELVQARMGTLPEYQLISQSGPSHAPLFVYDVSVEGASAAGEGPSKKEAQQSAAARLLEILSRAPAG